MRFLPSGKFFHGLLKIDLEVAAIFPGQFWKAQGPYFSFPDSDLKFEPFCNPNDIHAFSGWKHGIDRIIPFWFQKGMKIDKFVDAIIIFWKYGPSAFQNRSGNISATFSYDFKSFWSSVKIAVKHRGSLKKSVTYSRNSMSFLIFCC